MTDTLQTAPMLPDQIRSVDDLDRLRHDAYESHATYEAFLTEVLEKVASAKSGGQVNPDHCVSLAAGLLLGGRVEQAATWLARAADSPVAHLLRGRAEWARRHHQSALEHFEKASAAGVDAALCDGLKVATLLDMHELDRADEILNGPSKGRIAATTRNYLAGCLHAARGEYEKAVEALQQAVDADPHNSEAQFKLGYLLDLFGEDDAALAAYRNCTAGPPLHVNALINLAVLLKERNELEEAERCLLIVLETDPNHPRARLFLKDVRSSRSMSYDEVQERDLESRSKLLDLPISDFELSVRSRNCLKKMDIHTLGDLLRTSENDLLVYKNFGETSLHEIRNMLSQKGLHLGLLAKESGTSLGETRAAVYTPPGSSVVLNKSVSEIELSVRARKCLQRLGLMSLGDLAARTEAELLGAKNFGVTSLNEIKQRLADHGLALRRLES